MKLPNVCNKCSHILVMNAFSKSNCKYCNKEITTSHMPTYIICKECAEEKGLCMQCGKIDNNMCKVCGEIEAEKDGFCPKCKNEHIQRINKWRSSND